MASNTSRKRATKFVPPSERFAHDPQRRPAAPAAPKAEPKPISVDDFREWRNKPETKAQLAHSRPAMPRPNHLGRNAAMAAGVGGVAIGGGYLVHRHNQKKAAMSKNLVDPFNDVVVFGKAYPVVEPVPRSVRVAALLPTGRHVGDANKLVHVHTKVRGHRQGPFGKSVSKGSVADGLKMAAGAKGVMPVRTPAGLKPEGALARRLKVNSKMPDAARQGRRLA